MSKHLNRQDELYTGDPNSTALVSNRFSYTFNANSYPASYTQHEHIPDVVLGIFSIYKLQMSVELNLAWQQLSRHLEVICFIMPGDVRPVICRYHKNRRFHCCYSSGIG